MITLTVSQIKTLAEFAGLVIDEHIRYDDDELATEVTIIQMPADVLSETYPCAYFTDYPEEGWRIL